MVAFDDGANGEVSTSLTLKLPLFLHANLDRVLEWLDDGESLTRYMQDFVQVASAYISMYDHGELPANLLSKLEKAIKVNALSIDVNQAIILAQVFQSCGSSYTMELLDRIIGGQIDDISIH